MSKHNTQEKRADVLYAFQLACEYPTSSDIIEWTKRYPQYADDIREHAEMLLAQHSRSQFEQLEPDEDMLAKGRSVTMNAIYEAEQAAEQPVATHSDEISSNDASDVTPEIPTKANFDQLLKIVNQDIASLSREICIGRSVIAKLAAGRMKLPIGDRLLKAIASILRFSTDTIVNAIQQSSQQPRLGLAKARDRPGIETCSYEEAVMSCANMTDEQKQYWLDKTSSWIPGEKFD